MSHVDRRMFSPLHAGSRDSMYWGSDLHARAPGGYIDATNAHLGRVARRGGACEVVLVDEVAELLLPVPHLHPKSVQSKASSVRPCQSPR